MGTLKLIENTEYEPTYSDRIRLLFDGDSDTDLRQKLDRLYSRRSKYSTKLSKNQYKKYSTATDSMDAEAIVGLDWDEKSDLAMHISKVGRLQRIVYKLLRFDLSIKRIVEEMYYRDYDRPRLSLLVNHDESVGIRQLRSNMKAFDRRKKEADSDRQNKNNGIR